MIYATNLVCSNIPTEVVIFVKFIGTVGLDGTVCCYLSSINRAPDGHKFFTRSHYVLGIWEVEDNNLVSYNESSVLRPANSYIARHRMPILEQLWSEGYLAQQTSTECAALAGRLMVTLPVSLAYAITILSGLRDLRKRYHIRGRQADHYRGSITFQPDV